ncbi:MAG: dienelactone hydrolase family protein [Verrucomicrobiia bacterium]
MIRKTMSLAALLAMLGGAPSFAAEETLPPLKNGAAPQSFESMWEGFDPRAEPLDVEILKEWEEDGVVLKVLRYRIGVFKGEKAMMAAVYGYPKGGSKLPGLVQIHGGGQYADHQAPLLNAKRGYATISISWAGRISSPHYRANPQTVKLFWDNKTDDPGYRIITDWGALDAYHAPCRNPKNAFQKVSPASWTLDAVDSPRNNPWFLCALGARRALTFLERQPEVAADKLGVYGHSMGGKLTVLTTAADDRVKAAAPSCGGFSDRDSSYPLYLTTVADSVNLPHITCPIIFLSPANDFHGRIDDLQTATAEIQSDDWRVTCSPHHNHQDTAEYEVASLLWFDEHLKGTFSHPKTPGLELNLKTVNGIPIVSVSPDSAKPILSVDVFYTQHGQLAGEKNNHGNTMNRHWRHASTVRNGGKWTASLPLTSTDKPLWVYANVSYPLDSPVTGAGYYYRAYTAKTFNLSSQMRAATPAQLKAAAVKATLKPSTIIETFEPGWEKEWFTYRAEEWGRRTHKIYDEQWQAPKGARLALRVRSEKRNKMVIGVDGFANQIILIGDNAWQEIMLTPADFKDAEGRSLANWDGSMELRLLAAETLRSNRRGADRKSRKLGGPWQGAKPAFQNLRWIDAK